MMVAMTLELNLKRHNGWAMMASYSWAMMVFTRGLSIFVFALKSIHSRAMMGAMCHNANKQQLSLPLLTRGCDKKNMLYSTQQINKSNTTYTLIS